MSACSLSTAPSARDHVVVLTDRKDGVLFTVDCDQVRRFLIKDALAKQ